MTDIISPISPTLSSPAERLFPTLTPAQMARVAARGHVRPIREGEVLMVKLLTWRRAKDALSTAIAKLGKAVRQAISQSDELGDADTTDIFTEASGGLDKLLWFVESHLQAKS